MAGYSNPKFYKECKALFICGTPLATDKGFEDKLKANVEKSKDMLKEAGYDGAPVVLLYATDTNTGRLRRSPRRCSSAAASRSRCIAMDWQTRLARRSRKEAPAAGGWAAS